MPDDVGYLVVEDRWPGEGPLGGVITALMEAGGDVVVAACDLPDLDAATVRSVRDAPGADGARRSWPRPIGWSPRSLGGTTVRSTQLTAIFTNGERALHAALGRLDVVEVAVDPIALRNVNSPGDLGEGAGTR